MEGTMMHPSSSPRRKSVRPRGLPGRAWARLRFQVMIQGLMLSVALVGTAHNAHVHWLRSTNFVGFEYTNKECGQTPEALADLATSRQVLEAASRDLKVASLTQLRGARDPARAL